MAVAILSLMPAQGKLLLKFSVEGGAAQVALAGYPSGVYIVRVVEKTGV